MEEDEIVEDEEEKFSLDDIEEIERAPKEDRFKLRAKIAEKYQNENTPSKKAWSKLKKSLFPGPPQIHTEGVTRVSQSELLDQSDILDAVMGQQDKKTTKHIPPTSFNPIIFPKENRVAPNSLLSLPQDYANSAVIDTSFMDAFRYNKDYEGIDIVGPRVPSHKQERMNEQIRNIEKINAGTYVPHSRKEIPEEEMYPFLDKMMLSPINPKVIQPIIDIEPVKRPKISRERVHSNEKFDIKQELNEYAKIRPKPSPINKSIIKKTFKKPEMHIRKLREKEFWNGLGSIFDEE